MVRVGKPAIVRDGGDAEIAAGEERGGAGQAQQLEGRDRPDPIVVAEQAAEVAGGDARGSRQLVVTVGEGSLHEQGEQEPEGLLDGLVVGAGAVLAEVEQVAQQDAPARGRHDGPSRPPRPWGWCPGPPPTPTRARWTWCRRTSGPMGKAAAFADRRLVYCLEERPSGRSSSLGAMLAK